MPSAAHQRVLFLSHTISRARSEIVAYIPKHLPELVRNYNKKEVFKVLMYSNYGLSYITSRQPCASCYTSVRQTQQLLVGRRCCEDSVHNSSRSLVVQDYNKDLLT